MSILIGISVITVTQPTKKCSSNTVFQSEAITPFLNSFKTKLLLPGSPLPLLYTYFKTHQNVEKTNTHLQHQLQDFFAFSNEFVQQISEKITIRLIYNTLMLLVAAKFLSPYLLYAALAIVLFDTARGTPAIWSKDDPFVYWRVFTTQFAKELESRHTPSWLSGALGYYIQAMLYMDKVAELGFEKLPLWKQRMRYAEWWLLPSRKVLPKILKGIEFGKTLASKPAFKLKDLPPHAFSHPLMFSAGLLISSYLWPESSILSAEEWYDHLRMNRSLGSILLEYLPFDGTVASLPIRDGKLSVDDSHLPDYLKNLKNKHDIEALHVTYAYEPSSGVNSPFPLETLRTIIQLVHQEGLLVYIDISAPTKSETIERALEACAAGADAFAWTPLYTHGTEGIANISFIDSTLEDIRTKGKRPVILQNSPASHKNKGRHLSAPLVKRLIRENQIIGVIDFSGNSVGLNPVLLQAA